jgi:hypothetical protein
MITSPVCRIISDSLGYKWAKFRRMELCLDSLQEKFDIPDSAEFIEFRFFKSNKRGRVKVKFSWCGYTVRVDDDRDKYGPFSYRLLINAGKIIEEFLDGQKIWYIEVYYW